MLKGDSIRTACAATCIAMVCAAAAQAQVDWEDLFGDTGAAEAPAPKPAPPPAPAPAQPAMPAPRETSASVAPVRPAGATAYVVPGPRVRNYVNVRKQPSVGTPVIGRLRPGDHAVLLESRDGWHRVRLAAGATGFVSADWTRVVSDVSHAAAAASRREAKRPPAPRVAAAAPPPPATVRPRSAAPESAAASPPQAVSAAAPKQPVAEPKPSSTTATGGLVPKTPASQAPARTAMGLPSLARFGLKPGDVVDRSNYERYQQLLPPGLAWAVIQGWRLPVVEPRRIELPRLYREATEKFSGQVRLSPDGLRLINYVAGQPFPHLDPNDPLIAYKIMWNFYYNYFPTDDLAERWFETDTGNVGPGASIDVERHFLFDDYRKLMYTGRIMVDPKPERPNPEGVRFKESFHPAREPFDLKGLGATFYRYLDPQKPDDSWVYIPQLRRVRRLSTAQRSDALFGQDTDADAFGGYNGHVAWMEYRFLGEKTILATMHARNFPAKWQQPEDWLWDDVWEPRRVWVIEARSKVPQYAYSKRVLYIDQEGWVVPISDSYDRAGQLWRSSCQMWAFKKEVYPGAKLASYEDEWPFLHATVIFDSQLQHATATSLPSRFSKGEEGIIFNRGERAGTTEEYFTIAHLIEAGS